MAATLITGFAAHWVLGVPILVGLVFGTVTAIQFRCCPSSRRCRFRNSCPSSSKAKACSTTERLPPSCDVLGGGGVGLTIGYLFSILTERNDQPQIEKGLELHS